MKRTKLALLAAAIMSLATFSHAFTYDTFTGTYTVGNASFGAYTNFTEVWSGYNDIKINVNFDTAYTNMQFRMSYPRSGTVFLDVTAPTITGLTNFQYTVARTNLPPAGMYYCEFAGFDVANITNIPTRVLATGTVTIEHSVYENTTQSTWTNPLAGTVIGPPTHTITAETNWPFIQKSIGTSTGDLLYASASNVWTRLGSGTVGYYLRAGGADTAPSWAALPGGGDMLKSTYDTNANSVVDNSEQLGGTAAALYAKLADFDTFSELDTLVADKTLVNEEDVATIDANWVNTNNPWAVNEGGSGAATFTDGGVLLGSGTSAFTPMAVLADGEMIVGDGTTDPVAESGSTLRTSIGVVSGGAGDIWVELTETDDVVTIDSANARTNIYGGKVSRLGDEVWFSDGGVGTIGMNFYASAATGTVTWDGSVDRFAYADTVTGPTFIVGTLLDANGVVALGDSGDNLTIAGNTNIVTGIVTIDGTQTASGTDLNGNIFTKGWLTTLGSTIASNLFTSVVVANNSSVSAELIENPNVTNDTAWNYTANSAFQSSGAFSNKIAITAGTTGTFQQSNTVTHTKGNVYTIGYAISVPAGTGTVSVIFGSETNTTAFTANGTKSYTHVTSTTNQPTWSVVAAAASAVYLDDFTIKNITDGDLHVAGTGYFGSLNVGGVALPSASDFTQDGGVLVGTGVATFQEEAGATLRTSVGVGTGDSPQFSGLSLTGVLNMGANVITNGQVLYLKEQAAANASQAGQGQFWVKIASPNQAWFTDDAGTDFRLVGGNLTLADNEWVGLGAAAGRIEFDNQATDEVNILAANVGIGTNAPATTLDVNGATTLRGATTITTGDLTMNAGNVDVTTADAAGPSVIIRGPAMNANALQLQVTNASNGDVFTLDEDGDVVAAATIRSGTSSAYAEINGAGVSGDNLKVYRSDNNFVGAIFESDGTGQPIFTLRTDAKSDGGSLGAFFFDGNDSGNVNTRYATLLAKIVDNTEGTEDGAFVMEVFTNGASAEVARFTAAGLGLYTNLPAAKLHVNGTMQVDDLMCELSFQDGTVQPFTGGSFEQVTNMEVNVSDASYSNTDSNLTVTTAGRYTVYLDVSFATDAAEVLNMHLYTNNTVAVDFGGNNIGWDRNTAATLNNGVVACSKTLILPASCILDWRLQSATAANLTWNHGTFRVERR